MRKLILGLVLATAMATPSQAMYTQCTVQKTLPALDRPNGESFFTLDKGHAPGVGRLVDREKL